MTQVQVTMATGALLDLERNIFQVQHPYMHLITIFCSSLWIGNGIDDLQHQVSD
jgi:hypothetical protein